jgi:hypothetical protein
MCIQQGTNTWKGAKVREEEDELILTIPERRVLKSDEEVPLTLGISWGATDLTVKKWWGREVEIVTGKSSQFLSYLSVGVLLPDGIYLRDSNRTWGMGSDDGR